MKLLKYALILLFSAGMMSCGGGGGGGSEPDVDNTGPTITISAPTPNTEVDAGSNLTIDFYAEDDVTLSSYELKISYSGPKSVKTVEEFSFDSASDSDVDGDPLPSISGSTSARSFQIEIPDNAEPGNYKLEIEAIDSSGNTGEADVTFEVR